MHSMSLNNKNTLFVTLAAINASFGTFLYQYGMSVYNPLQMILENNIFPGSSILEKSFFASSPLFGGTFGSLAAGFIIRKMGRRSAMILIHFLSIISTLMTLVSNRLIFIIGRILSGFAGGVAFVIVNIYITEISEDPLRGQLGVIPPISGALALLSAYLLGLLIPFFEKQGIPDIGCRILLGFPAVLSLIAIGNLLFIFRFETPIYLLTQDKETEAKEVIKLLYSERHSAKLEDAIKEKEYLCHKKGISLADLWPGKYWKVFLASLFLITPAIYGSHIPLVFSNMLFSEGLDKSSTTLPFIFTSVIGVIYLAGNLLAMVIIKYIGRRTISLIGAALLVIINLALTLAIYFDSAGSIVIKSLVVVWMIVFSPTVNAIGYLYPSEAMPEIGVGVVNTLSYIVGFLLANIYLPLQASIGYGGIYLSYFIQSFIALIIMFCYLVETKDTQKHQIYKLYEQADQEEEQEELLADKDL